MPLQQDGIIFLNIDKFNYQLDIHQKLNHE